MRVFASLRPLVVTFGLLAATAQTSIAPEKGTYTVRPQEKRAFYVWSYEGKKYLTGVSESAPIEVSDDDIALFKAEPSIDVHEFPVNPKQTRLIDRIEGYKKAKQQLMHAEPR